MSQNSDYRNTVFLPQTSFPMRADLPRKEPQILAQWEEMKLWERMRAENRGARKFILHDGPPYANGPIHIGTALNKVLKDIINRSRQMSGLDAYYVPGWDCHGLPIEWKIEEEYRAAGRDKDSVPVLKFRAECRAYAEHWMKVQEKEFRRLGVAGDWAHRYATMDFPAEAAIAAEIGKFLLNGALYRGLQPVLWSPVEKTALAEAEVEYYEHTSTAIWVRFPLQKAPKPELAGAAVVIWTTTPWTIPGNRAIAYGRDLDYALIRIGSVTEGSLARPGEALLVAGALQESFAAALGITSYTVERVYRGEDLAGAVAAHPLRGHGYDFPVPLYAGDFVTTEAGTGFVHVAPGHGDDDFILGRAHGLEVPDTVGDDGTFNAWVPLFAGLHVYKADPRVCEELQKAGALLGRQDFVHSYPHSWRSKAPLIFRATPQWFIRMDGPQQIRAKALNEIARTHFVPDAGRNRIAGMIAARPDWCISRQRVWGVPIPVFVERATGEPLRDPAVLARIVEAFAAEGADAWYSSPPERFLGPGRNPADYEQVKDIVDVWFESGSTHAFVLEARGLPWPADLYLEGSDQHRGWFHSSLLEAVGTRGKAPFKAVLTHGFVLDEQGRKMSKSLGNVVAPQEVLEQYGADILRLWVMMSDITDDLRIGPDILRQQAEVYRRVRNTFRFLLGCLYNFKPEERLPEAEMPELERFVLHRLYELDQRIRKAAESYDWVGVYPELHAFCANDLSAFYFDIRKDTLYCDRPDNLRRRAARTVLDHLQRCLSIWFAPVLVFTAEEAWWTRFGDDVSVHLQTFPELPKAWRDEELARKWQAVRAIRGVLTQKLDEARKAGSLGSSLQARAEFVFPPDAEIWLSEAEWAEIGIVSAATVRREAGVEPPCRVELHRAEGEKCARCWRVLPEVGENKRHPLLCRRCVDAVESGLVSPSAAA